MAHIIHDFMHYNGYMSQDFPSLMVQSLSPAALMLIRRIAVEADTLKMPLYSIGGLPRDLLLGRDGADFDFVVEGDAALLANVLVSK